ncbi:MAG TPA: hypothetical protein VMM36_05305 [Opitutaceae bacterium]|nr:hypothetical protein [Opitutaceae bacterium]
MRERTLSVAALRQLVADRLPGPADSRRGAAALPTGVPALDEALGGGLASGALTEIVSAGAGSGGQFVQLCLLCAAAGLGRRAALVDGADAFDPQTAGAEALRALIWVRCGDAATAMQAADLLVRDANLGLVLLDLRGCPQSALRRTPATAWYRLQRAAEGTAAPVVVHTSQALVPSAACRVALTGRFGIDSCGRPRDALSAEVEVELLRARWAGGFAEAAG